MTSYHPPTDETRFLLHHVLRPDQERRADGHPLLDLDLADVVLESAARVAVDLVGPMNRVGDEHGSRLPLEGTGDVQAPPGFQELYRRFVAGGWTGLDIAERYGGQDLPLVLHAAVAEMWGGANLAFSMVPQLQSAAARVLAVHDPDGLGAAYLPGIAEGTVAATITMTEPHAGSDVGRARTRAVEQPDGTWALSGTKMFISWGDHDLAPQIVHLVLARTPGAPEGGRGLSLFVVPKWLEAPRRRNRVRAVGVERKMGLKASPTCVMEFDGATGFLIGGLGNGLRTIFTMVNSMRLAVAVQGMAVAHAAWARADAYARERVQGDGPRGEKGPVPLIDHPDIRRTLLGMRTTVVGLRALLLETALLLDIARRGGDEDRGREAQDLAEWLLPIGKTLATEAGFEVSSQAMQVFGGHGYVVEQGVEQYLRDSRVGAIYEGANGIQALDLLRRKLGDDGGRRFALFAGRVAADLGRYGEGVEVQELAGALGHALLRCREVAQELRRRLAEDSPVALAGATPFLQLAGTVALGWMWLRIVGQGGGRGHGQPGPYADLPGLGRFVARSVLPRADLFAAQALDGAEAAMDVAP